MSLTVRQVHAWKQFENEKNAAMANRIGGLPHYVVPGASATHFAFMKDHHKRVYTTLDLAYADVVSGRGDAIICSAGTHTPTASIVASKNNVSIWGMEAWCGLSVRKPTAIIVGPAADEAFNITGTNMEFHGLTCRPITAKSFADFTGAADGLTVRGCFIDLFTPVVNIATEGFTASAAIEDFLFENNVAWSDGAQGPAVELTGANLNGLFRNNHYHVDLGTWASAVNLIAPDGIVVDRDLATCGGTAMTACHTGSSTTVIAGVVFKDCRCGVLVTKMFDGFDTTSHAEIVGNHTATIGGGTGETLITVIT